MAVIRGRSHEVEALDGLMAGALAGAGAVVVIDGPPGIGKTRLLEHAATRGGEQSLTVASGRADELDRLSPWLTLLQAFQSSAPPILDPHQAPSAPLALDPRGGTLERFQAALEQAASRRPLLILLDDLQWADEATVAALGRLPAQLFSYPIVWTLARRPLPSTPALEALVSRLKAAGARHWALEPLDEAAAFQLAADVAGQPVDLQPRQLLAATGGNPLFIIEMMREYGTPRSLPQRRHDPDRRPFAVASEHSLRAVVEEHVRLLSPPTVELLKVASVLGRAFAAAELSELSGRPSAHLLLAVDEATRGGLLVDEHPRLAFRHDLFRQVLYESMPTSMRHSLHRDAALLLRRSGASPARLANQLLIGAEAGDAEAIASLHQAIGQLASTSPWNAAELARRLLELIPEGAEGRAAAVSIAVGALGWAGATEEACRLGEGFLDGSPVSPATEAEILLGIRRAWVRRDVRPYPRSTPQRILADPGIPASVRGTLLAFEQIEGLCGTDLAGADAGLGEAMALFEHPEADLNATSVQAFWTVAAQSRGRFTVALERACRYPELFQSTNAAGVAIAEGTVAQCLGGLGRVQEGLRRVERATRAAEASGYSYVTTLCQSLRAGFLLDSGRISDASAEASASSTVALDAGFLNFLTFSLTTLVEASVRGGDLTAAGAALALLPPLPPGDPTGPLNPDQFWARAMTAQAHGHLPAAMRVLEPVFTALAAGNFAIACRHPGRLPQLVGLAMRQGADDAARTVAAAATRLAQANPEVAILEQVAWHAQGLLERDESLLREAYDRSRGSEVRLLHAVLCEDLGTLAAEAGRSLEAVPALEEAFDLFTEGGARLDAGRVRAGLRKLGVRKRQATVGRPQRGWQSLTRAELSVVLVVGRGVTNRTAADELSISPDTVSTHLQHAFAKLEIRSRAELARLVAMQRA